MSIDLCAHGAHLVIASTSCKHFWRQASITCDAPTGRGRQQKAQCADACSWRLRLTASVSSGQGCGARAPVHGQIGPLRGSARLEDGPPIARACSTNFA
eukprot:6212481-Pleurochrysis_carterae.AAC.3